MVGHKRCFECGFLFFIWGISFEIGLHTRRSTQNGSALREFKSQLRLRLFMASQQLQPTSAIKSASQASQQVSRAPQCFEFFPLTFFGIQSEYECNPRNLKPVTALRSAHYKFSSFNRYDRQRSTFLLTAILHFIDLQYLDNKNASRTNVACCWLVGSFVRSFVCLSVHPIMGNRDLLCTHSPMPILPNDIQFRKPLNFAQILRHSFFILDKIINTQRKGGMTEGVR